MSGSVDLSKEVRVKSEAADAKSPEGNQESGSNSADAPHATIVLGSDSRDSTNPSDSSELPVQATAKEKDKTVSQDMGQVNSTELGKLVPKEEKSVAMKPEKKEEITLLSDDEEVKPAISSMGLGLRPSTDGAPETPVVKRGRGRPKGSGVKNKPATAEETVRETRVSQDASVDLEPSTIRKRAYRKSSTGSPPTRVTASRKAKPDHFVDNGSEFSSASDEEEDDSESEDTEIAKPIRKRGRPAKVVANHVQVRGANSSASDLAGFDSATRALLKAKDDVIKGKVDLIASKDQLIAQLQDEVKNLRALLASNQKTPGKQTTSTVQANSNQKGGPVKRGRGRPRKIPIPEESDEDTE